MKWMPVLLICLLLLNFIGYLPFAAYQKIPGFLKGILYTLKTSILLLLILYIFSSFNNESYLNLALSLFLLSALTEWAIQVFLKD